MRRLTDTEFAVMLSIRKAVGAAAAWDTTAIYANAVRAEEKDIARRMWG
jgi:hypothetical protein